MVLWERHWKHKQAILYWILALTGSQWSVLSSDVALTCLGLRRTIRAAWFCMCWSLFSLLSGRPATSGNTIDKSIWLLYWLHCLEIQLVGLSDNSTDKTIWQLSWWDYLAKLLIALCRQRYWLDYLAIVLTKLSNIVHRQLCYIISDEMPCILLRHYIQGIDVHRGWI